MNRTLIIRALGALLVTLVAMQLIPYRASNPPVVQNPDWVGTQTEHLARRACFDCHSNEVVVPWYGQIAPFAWVVRHHVDEGRSYLNFSEMNRPQEEAHEAAETVQEGEMPPAYYVALHPEANLTNAEKLLLIGGLNATLGGGGGTEVPGMEGGWGGRHDDDDGGSEDDD